MNDKKDDEKALLPIPEEDRQSEDQSPVDENPVDENYAEARDYFQQSLAQMLRTNAALLTVLGIFVVRGVRWLWEWVKWYAARWRK